MSKGERTRLQIIESAYPLFLSQGYHGTSIRQIAKHTGIALGGIYNHFTGKEAIFEAVFLAKHPYRRVAGALRATRADTIQEVFERLNALIWQMTANRSDVFNLLFIEVVELGSTHLDQIHEVVFSDFVNFFDRIRSLPPGIRDISSPILARTLIGTLISMQVTEVIMGKRFRAHEGRDYLRESMKIYVRGILEEGSHEARIHPEL